jgi:hypothetical protein
MTSYQPDPPAPEPEPIVPEPLPGHEAVAGLEQPPVVSESRRHKMSERLDGLVLAIAYTALGLTAFVVVVGGLVCILDNGYPFAQYISDLRQMSSWMIAAGIVVAAKMLAPFVRINRSPSDR